MSIARVQWREVRRQFQSTSPFCYAVLDDFLTAEDCQRLRQNLLNHWGWRRKHPKSQQLFNARPHLPEVATMAAVLKQEARWLLGELELVSHWALLYPSNVGLAPHADAGRIQFNLWLTPDEFNLDPNTGGLIFFARKRSEQAPVHEYNGDVSMDGVQRIATVGYRYNRALLFDAAVFHASDHVRFHSTSTASYRMNLSFSFDDPKAYGERLSLYRR